MLRILIADDHAVVQQGLKQILAEELPAVHFGTAATAAQTLAALQEGSWDILVLDLFMPGTSGLEVLQAVRQKQPSLPVLVLSSAPEEQLAVRAIRGGARGYLNKQTAPEHLVEAVREILRGGHYVSSKLGAHLAKTGGGGRPLHDALSDREFEVFRLVVRGRCLKEIAGDLGLSVKTVRTFHARLLAKLHLQSDVELVHYASAHQLLDSSKTSS